MSQGRVAPNHLHFVTSWYALQVDDDPYFKRDGSDIHVDVPVSFTQAILGATIDVLTLDGMVELKVNTLSVLVSVLSFSKASNGYRILCFAFSGSARDSTRDLTTDEVEGNP